MCPVPVWCSPGRCVAPGWEIHEPFRCRSCESFSDCLRLKLDETAESPRVPGRPMSRPCDSGRVKALCPAFISSAPWRSRFVSSWRAWLNVHDAQIIFCGVIFWFSTTTFCWSCGMIFLFFGKSEYYGDDLIDFYLLKIYFACITRQRKCRIRKLNETFFFFFGLPGWYGIAKWTFNRLNVSCPVRTDWRALFLWDPGLAVQRVLSAPKHIFFLCDLLASLHSLLVLLKWSQAAIFCVLGSCHL